MTVRKAPEMMTRKNIEELIDRGAKVKADNDSEIKRNEFLNLRIPIGMLNELDKAVSERVGISRTGWILEAIHEKLKNINQ